MKTIKRLFLQTLLAIVFVTSIIACETDCVPKETIVRSTLTPQRLSFFPYDSLDTIKCIIDSQQTWVIQSYTKVDGIEKYAEGGEVPCGPREVYENHYRIVNYYDQNGKLMLRAKLQMKSQTVMFLEFGFYELPIRGSYTISIANNSAQDTFNYGGHFYDDVYINHDKFNDYILYYSKTLGVVLITKNSKPLFQLIH